jgi:hypothetical protein
LNSQSEPEPEPVPVDDVPIPTANQTTGISGSTLDNQTKTASSDKIIEQLGNTLTNMTQDPSTSELEIRMECTRTKDTFPYRYLCIIYSDGSIIGRPFTVP